MLCTARFSEVLFMWAQYKWCPWNCAVHISNDYAISKDIQTTQRICPRLFIGYSGSTPIVLLSIIQCWKLREMKHPRGPKYLYFQSHQAYVLHSSSANLYYSEFHWNWPKPLGHFLPSFTCYPGIIGLKLITGSLIMGPIDSVFQLREAIKKFTLINQG